MAAVSIDVNSWPSFILKWTFAGLWASIGFALAAKFIIPNVPFL